MIVCLADVDASDMMSSMRKLLPLVPVCVSMVGGGLAFMISQSPIAVPKALEPWVTEAGWPKAASWLAGPQAPLIIGGGLFWSSAAVAMLALLVFLLSLADLGTGSTNLSIRVGDEGRFTTSKSRGFYARERTLYLEAFNQSKETSIHGCKATLIANTPEDTDDGPWLLSTETFSLAPGEGKLIPLAFYGDAYDKTKFNCSDTFFRFATPKERPMPSIGTLQTATVEITGHGSSAVRRDVLLWVDEEGRIRAKSANWWTSTLGKPSVSISWARQTLSAKSNQLSRHN